jgi:16S rRNA (cytosine967-C5)-methyltransferase
MTAPARVAAYHALRVITADRADLPSALAKSRLRLADERDRALTAEIVTGSLRWQRSLDYLIEHFARRPGRKIDHEVLTILRLSVYQLLHLDRVPASAVVDDAVDLTRLARKPSATGFVNAVLRSTLRQRHRLPLPSRPTDPLSSRALAYLGITHSHPEWLVERWVHRHGFEATEKWVRFDNETPPLTLRANRLRITREGLIATLARDAIETEPLRYAPDGLVVTRGNPLRRPSEGLFFVQDEASQLVALCLGARPDERILDVCASPGGKSTAIAAAMHDSGIVVACDVRPRRLQLLVSTVKASAATHVHIVRITSEGLLPFAPVFDRVLVDAPCSGLGTLRRDPDIRWRRREDELNGLARNQLMLLDRSAEVVKSGGRLLYSTCSGEPEENDAVVEAFLSGHRDFRLYDLRQDLPALEPVLDGRGMLRTLPFAHGLEAFFAAALERE